MKVWKVGQHGNTAMIAYLPAVSLLPLLPFARSPRDEAGMSAHKQHEATREDTSPRWRGHGGKPVQCQA